MSDLIQSFQQLPYLWLTAGYGAAISSIAIVWDIVKYKQQSLHLSVSTSAGMKVTEANFAFGLTEQDANQLDFIVVTVSNIGGKTTTLTHIGIVAYNNWFMYCIARKSISILILIEKPPLPHILQSGHRYVCAYRQAYLTSRQADLQGKLCFVEITQTMSSKCFLGRLRLPFTKN
jgi:hypothetical protein